MPTALVCDVRVVVCWLRWNAVRDSRKLAVER